MEKNSSLQQKTNLNNATIDLSKAYILKGSLLLLPPEGAEYPSAIPRKFQSEKELQQLVMKNAGILFGENALVITETRKNSIDFSNGFVADAFVFHFKGLEKPRFYLLKILFSKVRLLQMFYEMTPLFSLLKSEEMHNKLIEKFCEPINKDKKLKEKIQLKTGQKDIAGFLTEAIKNKPSVLLISDSELNGLSTLMENYVDTWGKMVNRIIIKKYVSDKDILFALEPNFSEIGSKAPEKKDKAKVVRETEEAHLENTSQEMRDIFQKIKSDLIKADKEIRFNIKNYYISLHKGRNLAFFQIGRKKLSIVIMNPEKETRAQIKSNTVKTLADSVKKFWNGECTTVVIENGKNIGEVTALLKKVIAKA